MISKKRTSVFIGIFLVCLTLTSIAYVKYSAKAANIAAQGPINYAAELNFPTHSSSAILQNGQYLPSQGTYNQVASAGQTPLQPATPAVVKPQTISYTVKSGDTLWDIATAYKMTVAQLQALNNLNGDALKIGQTLVVSGTPAATEKTPAKTVAKTDRPVQVASRSGQLANAGMVLNKAAQYLHTPYKWGGSSPGGFDCSGYTQYVFRQMGYSLPRTAADQASVGVSVSRSNLKPGDLVFFACGGSGGISHVGIYAGNGQFIHSSSPRSGGVIYSSLSEDYYASSYAGARRVTR